MTWVGSTSTYINAVLRYEGVWRHDERHPHVSVMDRGYRGQPDTWNKDEIEFRKRFLMRIIFFCAQWGTQLAFAAVLADGSVVTWGFEKYGGDGAAFQDQFNHV